MLDTLDFNRARAICIGEVIQSEWVVMGCGGRCLKMLVFDRIVRTIDELLVTRAEAGG